MTSKHCNHFNFLTLALFSCVIALGLAAATASVSAEKRNITEKDLFDFVWIGDPQVSPDGSHAAFVRVTVNEKKEGYNTSIWSVLIAGGEEPHQLKKAGSGNAPASADEHESDVRIIARAVYRQDNESYIDPKHPTHIWLVAVPHGADEKVKPRQLTTGRFDEDSATWSKDGSQIYFTSDRNDEPYYELPKTDLYSVAAAGPASAGVKITTIDLQVGGFGRGAVAL